MKCCLKVFPRGNSYNKHNILAIHTISISSYFFTARNNVYIFYILPSISHAMNRFDILAKQKYIHIYIYIYIYIYVCVYIYIYSYLYIVI